MVAMITLKNVPRLDLAVGSIATLGANKASGPAKPEKRLSASALGSVLSSKLFKRHAFLKLYPALHLSTS
jgi:hypothetical protein